MLNMLFMFIEKLIEELINQFIFFTFRDVWITATTASVTTRKHLLLIFVIIIFTNSFCITCYFSFDIFYWP